MKTVNNSSSIDQIIGVKDLDAMGVTDKDVAYFLKYPFWLTPRKAIEQLRANGSWPRLNPNVQSREDACCDPVVLSAFADFWDDREIFTRLLHEYLGPEDVSAN